MNNCETMDDQNIDAAEKKVECQKDLKCEFKEREKMIPDNTSGLNLYIKNLGESVDDERLLKEFSLYGTIASAKVMKNKEGRSKGYGFVLFVDANEAEHAMMEMNGRDLGSRPLYVSIAKRRKERKEALKAFLATKDESTKTAQKKDEELKKERQNAEFGVNLYVKNLDDTIDDERLRKEFSLYGTITSVKVMTDEEGRSKGFGFVCFIAPNEASLAVNELNGRVIGSKPLYVTIAQRKDERKAHLKTQYMSHIERKKIHSIGQMFQPSAATSGFYVPTIHPSNRFFSIQAPRWSATGGQQGAINFKQNTNEANAAVQQVHATHTFHKLHKKPPIDKHLVTMLVNANPKEQKKILGDRLYPVIKSMHPTMAGKITGILLEIENSELLHMIEVPDALKVKVDEVVALLQQKNIYKKDFTSK